MDNYSERLKYIINSLGITENSFATSIGLERADVVYYVVKGKTKDPRVSLSQKIKAAYPSIDLNWLDAGVGEPFIKSDETDILKNRIVELEKEIDALRDKVENKIFKMILTDEQKKLASLE
jgi:hypothetical protein